MDTSFVSSLISCEKTIKTPPRKVMSVDPRNDYTLRNDFTCAAEDGKTFEVFMRMNTRLPYLFSVGLRYRSEDGIFTICRYNGKHGHRNKVSNNNSFDDYHIHKIFDEQLSNGQDSSLDAEPTAQYATFEEALYAFVHDCHIKDWEKHFPNLEEIISQVRIEGI